MKRTTVRTLAIIAGGAGIIAGIAAMRSATGETPPPPDPGTARSGVQPPPATEYWTPERMYDARPAPMPEDG